MEKGIFKKLNPKQLLINIIAMSLFYFIAKPAAMVFLDLDIEDEQAFLKERQQSVIELLLDGIVKRSLQGDDDVKTVFRLLSHSYFQSHH